jgi:hypothetical protein
VRRCARSAALLGLVLVALAGAARPALADGDPASDYLLSQSTFLSPFDAHVPVADSQALIAMLASAKAQGFPLKVAVIATSYDLGAVPILFHKPKTYAKFLAEEDYYYWRAELVVVMPNGYGVFKGKTLPAADAAAIDRLKPVGSANGAALVEAAEHAVRLLAARRGLTLSTSAPSKGSSSTGMERIEIGVGVLALVALAFGGRLFWRRLRA